ncbi:MAG: hypothetical protein DRQ10_00250 [Candidatus Hydrothermota bacterium]|nr:MAG: hypothetical protein DRQ10_00250 [Candidatus Hydrothermae bacterium]
MAEERSTGTGWTVVAFVTGALFGAALAFLLAPQPGEETRKKVKEEAEKLKEAALKKAAELIEEAKEKLEKGALSVKEEVGKEETGGNE